MAQNVHDRLSLLVKKKLGENSTQFAKSLDVSPGVISKMIGSRKTSPSFMMLERMLLMRNISANWLITGIGPTYFMGNEPKSLKEIHQDIQDEVDRLGAILAPMLADAIPQHTNPNQHGKPLHESTPAELALRVIGSEGMVRLLKKQLDANELMVANQQKLITSLEAQLKKKSSS